MASEICGTTQWRVTVQRLGCVGLQAVSRRYLLTTRLRSTGASRSRQRAARISSAASTSVTAVGLYSVSQKNEPETDGGNFVKS